MSESDKSADAGEIDPNEGDFVVVRGSYHWGVARVIKRTAKQILAEGVDHWYGTILNPLNVRFVGTRDACLKLRGRLASSDAQCEEEKRGAMLRKNVRDRKLISEAHQP